MDNQNQSLKGFKVKSFEDIMTSTTDSHRPIIKNLVYDKGITVIAGGDGVCKSWLGLQLGLRISTGKEFLNWEVSKRKFLLINFEMDDGQIRDRLGEMVKSKKYDESLLRENFKFVCLSKENKMFRDQWKKIKFTVEELGFKNGVLCIDNLYSSTNNDISANWELNKVMAEMSDLRMEHNLSIILLAHHNKGAKQFFELDKDQIQGGKQLTNFATSVFQMHKSSMNQNIVVGKITKAPRDDRCDLHNIPFKLLWDEKTFHFKKGSVITKESMHYQEVGKSIEIQMIRDLSELNAFKIDPEFDREKFLKHIPNKYGKIQDYKMTRILNKLLDFGLIKRIMHNKYQILYRELEEIDK